MSLTPILAAPPMVQLHVLAALCAVVLGPLALFRRSRDIWHKRLGYAWVLAMASTALSSFALTAQIGPGPISPIHILSASTLIALWRAITAARLGRISLHRKIMRDLYFWAIGIAGLFTFLTDRLMNTVLFGGGSMAGFVLMAALIGGGLLLYARANRRGAAALTLSQ